VVFSTLARCNLLVSFLSLCRFIRTKVIIREANTPSADMAKFKHAWLYRLLYRVLYRRADIIICQTNVMRDDLINHFGVPSEKAITIYNPVDVDRVREKFRSSESPFSSATNIVACGKLDHQKGFDILLDAFSKVKKQSGDVVLTIVGEGDNRIALEDQIDSLNLRDSVVMPGFKTNPYAYIGNADLFVLSSRWEGLPNVVLEAFALGIPVIAFDCEGGMKEIIIPAVNGILVPKESAEQLADAIIGQLKSPQTFDYDESLNKFSLKSVVQQYADTIQSLVP
ncbi:MAG: glycosyltransferase, partial [Planctomycetota bacterium]